MFWSEEKYGRNLLYKLFITRLGQLPRRGGGGGGKIDTLFKTKILKKIPWLAARPH